MDQISSWKEFSSKLILENENSGFQETFELARIINFITQRGYTWGTNCFSAMVRTPYPIIAFPGKTVRTLDYEYHQKNNFDSVSDIPFWGYDLRDIYPDLPKHPIWPLDFGVIYSSKELLHGHAELKDNKSNYDLEQVKKFIQEKFAFPLEKSSILPDFYEAFVRKENDFNSTDLLGIISVKLIDRLYRLLARGYHDEEINEFINLLQARHHSAASIDPVSMHMKKLFMELEGRLFGHSSSSNFSIFVLDDITLGGSIGFAGFPNIYRKVLEESVAALQKEYPEMSADYLSWRDGYCSDGVIVEQYLEHGIKSPHLGTNLYKTLFYSKEGKRESLTELRNISDIPAQNTIILNEIDNTISMNGDRLTSKELHSQKATIQLIDALLNSPDHRMENSSLPRSAYSLSKNDMTGKILIPFKKVVEQKTGRPIQLTARGSNTHFTIELALPDEVKVCLVKKFSP